MSVHPTGRVGRPAVGPAINIRIPADDLARLDAAAAAEGVTRVQWIRQAVAARLHAHDRKLDESG